MSVSLLFNENHLRDNLFVVNNYYHTDIQYACYEAKAWVCLEHVPIDTLMKSVIHIFPFIPFAGNQSRDQPSGKM